MRFSIISIWSSLFVGSLSARQISSASFSIISISGGNYTVRLDFESEGSHHSYLELNAVLLNKVKADNAYGQMQRYRLQNKRFRHLCELDSLNGHHHRNINKLLTRQGLDAFVRHNNFLGNLDCLKTFILDIRDSNQQYSNLANIKEGEQKFQKAISEALGAKKSTTAKETANLFRNIDVDFFVAEGSLKAMILNNIADKEQVEFLINKKSAGPGILCMLGKYVMDAWHSGRMMNLVSKDTPPVELRPENFYYRFGFSIDGSDDDSDDDDVHLHNLHQTTISTVLDSNYLQLYGPEGPYIKATKLPFLASVDGNETFKFTIKLPDLNVIYQQN